jgi:5-methyltetrahydrofolate--homocysteine methyltransferase
MERQGMKLPLLIGGATTSKIHTAVKLAPVYSGPTVYVLDASRSVNTASSVLSAEQQGPYLEAVREEYAGLRKLHAGRQAKAILPIAEARARGGKFSFDAGAIVKPTFLGTKVFTDFPLAQIRETIDWSPFFHAWELRGRYPKIFEDPTVGETAKKLFDDGQKLLNRIVHENLLQARGVIGFWPANRVGDDIELYTDDSRTQVLTTLHTLRQQVIKDNDQPNLALADYVAPKESGIADYVGAFALTTGIGIESIVAQFEKDHDDFSAIMAKALADRLAEAFAEHMHLLVRKELWGYAKNETLDNEALIREEYQGIRPAAGYPASPDHTEKRTIFDLLQAEKNAGVKLTENFAMYPTAAVSGLYFAHPSARYFNVGKIGRDQVEDYARRKGLDVATMERWLAPVLNYDV